MLKSAAHTVLALLLATAAALGSAACNEAPPPPPATTTSAAPSAAAPPPESKTRAALAVDPGGTATFDMKAPVENIKGLVSGLGGEIQVDLADLTQTRGAVTMDMTTLETHTFGDDGKDKTQTEHALGWLQVGSSNPEDLRSKYRLATFTIQEVISAAPKSILAAQGDPRTAELTVKGDFSLHGRSAVKTVKLTCAFTMEGDKVKSVSVKSVDPVLVNLKAHDIQPRDDKGEVVFAKVLELFGKKVADDASVTFELVARPKGSPGGTPTLPAPPAAKP